MNSEFKILFPDNIILQTEKVQLRLLNDHDIDDLFPISKSKSIWTYFTKDLSDGSELKQWVKDALLERQQEKRVPFIIIDKTTSKVCGSTSFGGISFYDKRIEIGWSWLGEEFMGTGINMHAKYLLLKHAFDVLDYIRVEIKTDNLNERAKKALIKIGATPEGVLRSHMQMFNNRRRDSIYFSILKHEWPGIMNNIFADLAKASEQAPSI